jgi:5S rRNA maturation endonuclease (ribonuclease M5)
MVYPVVLQTEAIKMGERRIAFGPYIEARQRRREPQDESGRSEAGHKIVTSLANGVLHSLSPTDLQREERRFREFGLFLRDLVKELNDLSEEGAAVLVEGKRDARAMAGLGYSGPVFTVSILTSNAAHREKLRKEVNKMIVLTDLDSEGRRLAARYMKFLSQEGISASLAQRRRLSKASRGVFLHIENLSRFALRGERLTDLG